MKNTEKLYRIRPEFYDNWTNSADYERDSIVTENEIKNLAAEWGVSVDDLMVEVEEMD